MPPPKKTSRPKRKKKTTAPPKKAKKTPPNQKKSAQKSKPQKTKPQKSSPPIKSRMAQSGLDSLETPSKTKIQTLARMLLRLYQYLEEGVPIEEPKLLALMDMNTPSEQLRNKMTQMELELQSVFEENHALSQNALQTQIEAEDQISSIELENMDLKLRIDQFELQLKEELEKVSNKYEDVVKAVKKELLTAVQKNEQITEVNERIKMLNENITSLFDQNEQLTSAKKTLTSDLKEMTRERDTLLKNVKKLEKKKIEFEKKVELQKMVIDGYKRKESAS
ncbi:MAG: hypothetical protein ACTSWW_03290 [Promethearchaeota archaeon]